MNKINYSQLTNWFKNVRAIRKDKRYLLDGGPGMFVVLALAVALVVMMVLPVVNTTSNSLSLNNALNVLNTHNYVAWAISGLSSGQVPYATGVNTLVGDSGFEYNATTNSLTIGGDNVTRGATFVVASSTSSQQADYVCSGVDDQVEINAAVAATTAIGGGTIILLDGTYNCSNYILPSQTTPTIIEGLGSATVLSWDSTTYTYLIGRHTGGSVIPGLTVRNLKIIDTNAIPKQSFGIMTGWNAGDTTCSDIVVEGVETEECGIWVANVLTGRCLVKNCYAHDITLGDRGIGLLYSHGAIVEGNTIENVAEMGIGSQRNYSILITGNVVKNASLVVTAAFAIDTGMSDNVSITGNLISSRNGILSENATESIQINNNTIFGKGVTLGTGVKVWRTTTSASQVDMIQIHDNKISNIQYLISVVDEDNASIIGNTGYMANRSIYVNKTAGWGVEPTLIKISNNTLVSCGREAYQAAISTGNCTGVYVEQNTVIGDNIANTYAVRFLAVGSRIVNNVFSDYPTMIATIATGATVGIKQNIGWLTESSGVSLGTGAQQTITHGLKFTPSYQDIGVFSDNVSGTAFQTQAPTSTNIYVTATAGSRWHWATVGK